MQNKATQDSDTQVAKSKWSWVESTIWTERMLAALENGVKGNKWFTLWDKVWKKETLRLAWEKVRRNKGSAGIDKISIKRFASNAETYLAELSEALKEGNYQPLPIKRVDIPKGDGKTRSLGIPVVKDRIVQAAIVKVIEPIFEKEFVDMSYGFRPERGCKDALRAVDNLLKAGHVWVVDADIQGYFDNIPQDKLMERIKERISDGSVLGIIQKYLKQRIMAELECYIPTKGTPQGAVLSPLLANIYLHPLDKLITGNGHKMVRYADDFVILCTSKEEAEQALEEVRRWTQDNGLTLHPDKTHLVNCMEPGNGFEFLGYRFEAGKRNVRKKSMKQLRDKVRMWTRRNVGVSVGCVIAALNPMLKGWFEYFKHADKYTFSSVDGFVRRRIRSILRRQNKQTGGTGRCLNDHMRWPNKFFAEQGLFTLQTAHDLARQSR